jgi:NADPH:quinone reductase
MGAVRAILVSRTGGPEVLEPVEIDMPSPGVGQILVRVAAAGVNYIDTYHRTGLYPQTLPFVPGLEGAGHVTALGPGVSGFTEGQAVAWAQGPGSYSAFVCLNAAAAVPVPDGVQIHDAAALMLQGLTAHYLLQGAAHPRAGDWVLIHAGAGGVGLLLLQMARSMGLRSITTVSTAEKAQRATAAGADVVIRYDDRASEDLVNDVMRATDGVGVSVAYDGVGRSTFEASLSATRARGTVVLFGAASGPVPPFDLQRLAGLGSLMITRPTLAHFVANRDELLWRAQEVLGAARDGSLNVHIHHRYDLGAASRAHEDLQARRTSGKLLLVP